MANIGPIEDCPRFLIGTLRALLEHQLLRGLGKAFNKDLIVSFAAEEAKERLMKNN